MFQEKSWLHERKLWFMALKWIQKKLSGRIPTQWVCLVQLHPLRDLRASHIWVSEALGVARLELCSHCKELSQDKEPDVSTRPQKDRFEYTQTPRWDLGVYLTLKPRENSGNVIETQRFACCCHKQKHFCIALQIISSYPFCSKGLGKPIGPALSLDASVPYPEDAMAVSEAKVVHIIKKTTLTDTITTWKTILIFQITRLWKSL